MLANFRNRGNRLLFILLRVHFGDSHAVMAGEKRDNYHNRFGFRKDSGSRRRPNFGRPRLL